MSRPTARDIADAWQRELPGMATESIDVITPLWALAKALSDDRRRTLARLGVEAGTLDLLSTLRRSGPPYELSSRQITERTLVTAGAISQRIARAEAAGYVTRRPSDTGPRAVAVKLTRRGHALIERTVRDLLAHEQELVETLSARDRRTLVRLVAALSERLSWPR